MVCPFGVIDISCDGKIAVKCDFCIERTKAGQEPACVEACPTKALQLVDEKELQRARRRSAAQELILSVEKSNKTKSASREQKEKQKENTQ